MDNIDDRLLVRDPQLSDSEPETPPRSSSTTIVVVAVVGLLIGAAGAWWWARDRSPAAQPPVSATATEGAVAPSATAAQPLPPLDQMDTFLRALIGALSASPELARWLATDDLIRQMANAIDRVSRGASPARELTVLRPTGTFVTAGRPNQMTIDPATYKRFDGIAAAVASLDARSVAEAYHTIRPRLDEAYRGLGRTEGTVDEAVSVALQVLIDTPTVSGPIRLVPGPGATYAFADPRLEALQPAQKQLLRMGPDNLARVQTRLREIKAAIEASRTR
jgi:hypothetical protein